MSNQQYITTKNNIYAKIDEEIKARFEKVESRAEMYGTTQTIEKFYKHFDQQRIMKIIDKYINVAFIRFAEQAQKSNETKEVEKPIETAKPKSKKVASKKMSNEKKYKVHDQWGEERFVTKSELEKIKKEVDALLSQINKIERG